MNNLCTIGCNSTGSAFLPIIRSAHNTGQTGPANHGMIPGRQSSQARRGEQTSHEACEHGVHSGLLGRTAARQLADAVIFPVDRAAYPAPEPGPYAGQPDSAVLVHGGLPRGSGQQLDRLPIAPVMIQPTVHKTRRHQVASNCGCAIGSPMAPAHRYVPRPGPPACGDLAERRHRIWLRRQQRQRADTRQAP